MAMGTHGILGASSPLMVVAGEVGLVTMIAQLAVSRDFWQTDVTFK
jgi:hypothetical protein